MRNRKAQIVLEHNSRTTRGTPRTFMEMRISVSRSPSLIAFRTCHATPLGCCLRPPAPCERSSSQRLPRVTASRNGMDCV